MKSFLRKILNTYLALTMRERLLIGVTAVVMVGFLASIPVTAFSELLDDNARIIEARKRHYDELSRTLKRYKELEGRLEKLRASFEQSQLTFEQVTSELDRIVRDTLGNSNYDLKKTTQTPEDLGLDFERQDFSLNIRAISLQQLVKLLYELEQGKTPLFVGKVDVTQGGTDETLTTTIEIASVSKKKSSSS